MSFPSSANPVGEPDEADLGSLPPSGGSLPVGESLPIEVSGLSPSVRDDRRPKSFGHERNTSRTNQPTPVLRSNLSIGDPNWLTDNPLIRDLLGQQSEAIGEGPNATPSYERLNSGSSTFFAGGRAEGHLPGPSPHKPMLNRNQSTWDTSPIPTMSPYGDFTTPFHVVSPLYGPNGGAMRGHFGGPHSVRNNPPPGQMSDSVAIWGTPSAYSGNLSARHAAARYLNINAGPDGRRVDASPPNMDVEPPGFPMIPMENSDGLGHQSLTDDAKLSAGLATPNMLVNNLPGFDQGGIPFWASQGHPSMPPMSDWSDGVIGNGWTTRNAFPGSVPPTPTGFYPTPSPLAGGATSAFPSPFVRMEPLFNFPQTPPVTTENMHHGEPPHEEAPSCPALYPNEDSGAETSQEAVDPTNFSPWRNLNDLPDCKPVDLPSAAPGSAVSKTPLPGLALSGGALSGVEGLASVAIGYDQANQGSSLMDVPSTPPSMGTMDEHQLSNRASPSSVNMQGPAPSKSLGSIHHPHDCRPCAFYWTKGCINGADCRFCHEWHPPKKKKPMKEQKNLMIIARPDGKIEFMRCTVQEAMRVL